MNYAISGGTISKHVHYQSFLTSCRREQLHKSLPHFVFLAFGAVDQINNGFSRKEFVKDYLEFIEEVQNLPSKPMVLLMVPVFTCLFSGVDHEYSSLTARSACKREQDLDLQQEIYEIANIRGIPEHHVINLWELLRLNPHVKSEDVFISDRMHPNRLGFSMIASEIYDKISHSKEFLERQDQVLRGEEPNFNNAVRQLLN